MILIYNGNLNLLKLSLDRSYCITDLVDATQLCKDRSSIENAIVRKFFEINYSLIYYITFLTSNRISASNKYVPRSLLVRIKSVRDLNSGES